MALEPKLAKQVCSKKALMHPLLVSDLPYLLLPLLPPTPHAHTNNTTLTHVHTTSKANVCLWHPRGTWTEALNWP